jgi:hypothetical protein
MKSIYYYYTYSSFLGVVHDGYLIYLSIMIVIVSCVGGHMFVVQYIVDENRPSIGKSSCLSIESFREQGAHCACARANAIRDIIVVC